MIPTSSATVQHVTSNLTIYARPMFARKAIERVLGKGVLTAEGERHKRQRKILNPAFSTDYIRKIVPIFSAKASELVTVLLDYVKSQLAQEIDVFPLLTRVTLDIISSSGSSVLLMISDVGFGYDFNTLHNPGDPFAIAYAKISRMTPGIRAFDIAAAYIPFLRNLPFPRVMEIAEARKSISIRASKLVQEKQRQTIAGKDILSVMIDENRKSQGGLSETEIVDQIMTFLFAGHETTSTAVDPSHHFINICSWHGVYIFLHSILKSKIACEQKWNIWMFRRLNRLNRVAICITFAERFYDTYPQVNTTHSVKLMLVSAVRREASVTDYVNGVIIPKGTIVVIPILATNFDETIWGPDVDVFNPDRWMENTSKFSYLTFLQGPRSCIGRSFAETEMKVLLVALIQRLRFEEVVKGKHIERHTVITTRPKHGMVLKISAI